jgi:hypothetical protein
MTSAAMQWTKAESGHVPPKIDITKPNVARMYDYWLGGKDNFEADRVAAERVLAQLPGQRRSALENRRFLRRAVRFLAGEAGIDQFLDIGVGLPTQGAVHEVAREINPKSRVAYVDYDPVVVAHGRALLATPDRSVVVQADIRQPRQLPPHPVRAGATIGNASALIPLPAELTAYPISRKRRSGSRTRATLPLARSEAAQLSD